MNKDIDSSVLLDTLDKSMENNNNYLYISEPIETEIKEVNTIDGYITTISPYHYLRYINKNYYKIDDDKKYINPYKEFLEYTNGNRNIYFQNDYSGNIRYLYNQTYENEPEKAKVADYVFTPIANSYPYNEIYYYNIHPMVFAQSVDYLYGNEHKYTVVDCPKYDYKYKHECDINKYDVYKIPKELLKMFTHITKYWNDIKKDLTLNEETGYYCYNVKTNDKTINIPIICKHQAMILNNIPMNKISLQCYTNGVCKYCGQEIIAYNDGTDFMLPTSAMSLIINFSEIFDHKYSNESIIFDTSDYIVKRLQNMNISSYSTDECVGWTCLILLKTCQLCMQKFKFSDAKVKKFINKLSKNLSILGKTDKDIDEFIKDESLFVGIDNLINMLSNDGVLDKQTTKETRMSNVDKIIFDNKDKTVKTQLQKYYIANDGKIYEMFLAFKSLLYNAYNSPYKYDIKDFINNITEDEINNIINTFGYDFFKKTAHIYCPVNQCHNWDKNKCKHCGLLKDLSNLNDVYNKYSYIINDVNTEDPNLKTTDIKYNKQDYKEIIIEIKKTNINNFNDVIKKYIDYEYVMKLSELTVKKSTKYIEHVAMMLNIPYDVLFDNLNDDNDMKRLFCYLLINQNEETTVNNLIIGLLNIDNPLQYIVKE